MLVFLRRDMKTKAILFSLLLLASAIPSAAGVDYNGTQIGRPAVADFTLSNQTGENFSFYSLTGDVTVVSFIFTRCIDVCPIITQKLRSVQLDLDDSLKVNFVSISVDPNYDTPEKLTSYMNMHGVDWPHLTGEMDTIKPVWDLFFVISKPLTVASEPTTNVSEVMAEMNMTSDMHDTNLTSGMAVIVVNGSGVANQYEVLPTGHHLLEGVAFEANWNVNYSSLENENVVVGFNEINNPEDMSWFWEVHIWNESDSIWKPVEGNNLDDVDALNHSNLAFAPNTTDDSEIPLSTDQNVSVTLVYPNGSNETTILSDINGWHMTASALDFAGVNFSAPDSPPYGHYLESIENEPSVNASWHWNLHVWNKENNTWSDSDSGLDELNGQDYIAWAPNSTSHDQIPAPNAHLIDQSECDEHGWIMGEGQNAHCMCDAGYTWPGDDMLSCVEIAPDEPDYTVGHSSSTYILDANFKPVVSWPGSDWAVAEVVADIHMVATGSKEIGDASDDDDSWLPGFTFAMISSAVGLAIIATKRED